MYLDRYNKIHLDISRYRVRADPMNVNHAMNNHYNIQLNLKIDFFCLKIVIFDLTCSKFNWLQHLPICQSNIKFRVDISRYI